MSFKKTAYHVIVIIMVQFISGCADQDEVLIGEWKGESLNTPVSLRFYKAHRASISVGSVTFGGENDNVAPGRKIELESKIDYSKEPYLLELTTIVDGFKSESPVAKGTLRLITDKKLEAQIVVNMGDSFKSLVTNDDINKIILEKQNK